MDFTTCYAKNYSSITAVVNIINTASCVMRHNKRNRSRNNRANTSAASTKQACRQSKLYRAR